MIILVLRGGNYISTVVREISILFVNGKFFVFLFVFWGRGDGEIVCVDCIILGDIIEWVNCWLCIWCWFKEIGCLWWWISRSLVVRHGRGKLTIRNISRGIGVKVGEFGNVDEIVVEREVVFGGEESRRLEIAIVVFVRVDRVIGAPFDNKATVLVGVERKSFISSNGGVGDRQRNIRRWRDTREPEARLRK